MTRQYPAGTTEELDPEDDYDDYDDYDDVVYYEDPGRWRWVAAGAAAVLALAVIGTVVILRGGDTATTTGRIVPSSAAPATTPPVATTPLPAATSPSASLPQETVTTLTPSATTSTEAAPASPEVDPRTITYTVFGTRQPGDLVTVTYLDETGAPRTEFNVTLPWTKTVVVGGNVLLNSVTAVSVASHLNCSITDATGQTVASQGYDTIATSCNR